jgi:ribokinase
VPNEHEAAALTGVPDPERAARVLQAATGAPVIVTLGARGALLLDGDAVTQVAAPAVEAVDTTGAGDCLCGTLAARLAAGDPLGAALEVAVEAASLSTLTPGAR